MMTPAPTDYTSEIVAIRRAIATGATRYSYDGKSVDYESLDLLKQRLGLLLTWQAQVANPGYRRPQAGFATFSRGTYGR